MSHQSDLIASDIEGYLKQHEQKELMRFLTCGNVDDGKSTLIGRLLHDSKMIFEDQMASIKKDSKKFNTTNEEFDLALLVDGLQSEREQGITIDVAYRYFSTDKRKFIIADTPGHEQYTRNMATGASTCDLAVILIDARYGVQTQTRRHSFIVSLLGIKQVIVAVNKMDLMDFSEKVFEQIRSDYLKFAEKLDIPHIKFVPLSALKGDNVVERSEHTSWYHGETLMTMLESAEITVASNFEDFRLPVQYVNRPNLNFRGFAGTIAGGVVRVGDEVVALPSGKQSRVKGIITFDGELEEASVGQAITLTLEDEIDVSRGDTLVHANNRPQVTDALDAIIVWMAEDPMLPRKQYDFKLATKTTAGSIAEVDYQIDVNTMEHNDTVRLNLNEIGRCQVSLNQPVAFDSYQKVKGCGSFIVIDRLTNVTVGAGMIIGAGKRAEKSRSQFSEFELELNALVRKHFPHWDAKDLLEMMK
jgi:sulfate adenylyltransferase subunit 1